MGEVDRKLIAELIRLLEAEGLQELVVEEAGLRIAVRKDVEAPSGSTPAPEGAAAVVPQPRRETERSAQPEEHGETAIASPIAGVFYRAPSPGVRPYVSEGDEVEEGDMVGIVEAMKVMNEITSHVAGTVTRIVAEDQDLVAVGQVLMWVQPL